MPYSCPQKKREQARRWHRNNRERRNSAARQRQKDWTAWTRQLCSVWGCVTCGITDPDVLEFHHIDPSTKKYNVSSMNRVSLIGVIEELKKVCVVCANCHKKAHIKLREES